MPYIDPIPESFICPLSDGADVMKDPVTHSGRVYDRQNLKAHFEETGQEDVSAKCIPDKVLKRKISEWVEKQERMAKQFEIMTKQADKMQAEADKQMLEEAEKIFRQRDAEQAVLREKEQARQAEQNDIAASRANAEKQGLKQVPREVFGDARESGGYEILRIGFVGPSGSGKTALTQRINNHTFAKTYVPSVGSNPISFDIEVEGNPVRFHLIDESGQERYSGSSKLQAMDVVLLVVDLANPKSLSEAQEFLNNRIRTHSRQGSRIVLVGNKVDARVEENSPKVIAQFAKDNNLTYFETSAKTGDNVFSMLQSAAQNAVQVVEGRRESKRAKEESDWKLVKDFRDTFKHKFAGSYSFFHQDIDKKVNSDLSRINADEIRRIAKDNPKSIAAAALDELSKRPGKS